MHSTRGSETKLTSAARETDYLVVGRVLRKVGKPVHIICFWLQPDKLAKFFVASDICCFFLQASGGSLMAIQEEDMQNLGKAVVLASLAIQLAFFSAFTYVVTLIQRNDEYNCSHKQAPALTPVFVCLWITIVLLYVRNIFRTIEFANDRGSFVVTHEWLFYAFESLPIFLAVLALTSFHFGRLMECQGVDQPRWMAQIDAANATDAANAADAGKTVIGYDAPHCEDKAVVAPALKEDV